MDERDKYDKLLTVTACIALIAVSLGMFALTIAALVSLIRG